MLTDVGECDDLLALGRDLEGCDAQQRRGEIDVGEPGILRMKA